MPPDETRAVKAEPRTDPSFSFFFLFTFLFRILIFSGLALAFTWSVYYIGLRDAKYYCDVYV